MRPFPSLSEVKPRMKGFEPFEVFMKRAYFQYAEHVLKSKPPRYDVALEQLERLVVLEPNHLRAVRFMGALLAEPEARDGAKALLEQVVQLDGAPALSRKFLGDYEATEERHAEAIALYEAALKRAPKFPGAKNNLAWCLMRVSPPQLERALQLVDEALAEQQAAGGVDPTFFETRGQIFFRLKRYGEAAADLERALRFMPEETKAKVHGTLALVYKALGAEGLAKTHEDLAKEGSTLDGS